MTVDPEYQQQLEAANAERDQLLATISDQLGVLELDDPPSLAPISINSDGADDLLAAAAAATTEISNNGPEVGDKGAELVAALSAFQEQRPDQPGLFEERTTPVVVISLAGLRRIQSILSELVQRREAPPAE